MPRPTAPPVNLPLTLDREAGGLTRQLAGQLRAAVRSGVLTPGQRMPSTRALADALDVGRGVVFEAFDALLAEGYLIGRDRSGTFVAPDLPPDSPGARPAPVVTARWLRPVPDAQVEPPTPQALLAFRVGQTDTRYLNGGAWRQVWRRVALDALPDDYADPAGDPDLRAEVAAYLRRARGLVCGADDVIITSGALQGVDLIAQATLTPGDAVAFEDPGYRLARQTFEARGADLLPVPVDGDGLTVGALPTGAGAPLLVYTTPSHQFPLGVRLSVPRRLALLDWAQQHDALILEDDYDSEFRFGATPLPALASLDTAGCVVYLGTFSKVLSPAVRVGYVVAPAPLRDRLLALKARADAHTSWPVQRALSALLAGGHLEAHIRRMRREYSARRLALDEELTPLAPHARLLGLAAGLHVYLDFTAGLDAAAVAAACRQQGVLVSPVAPLYRGAPDRAGLLLGYGGLTAAEVRRGAQVIVQAVQDHVN
ncbi:MocR-like pyridoxine biosynthesis transcription factor PdxR [Deinococcus radiotolerans]|uniref:GntR family transcriptional regulator n=1 Tax=Deinococcus radiotolerans TaxID=1309407 RepID=A0ABQ2FJ35_9DEIO|nr:PLP-dependent aminotransferase family protein [Deinococcus radiotolerans]GGK99752.1 GntR family transcriptional regulator [Deinococcus radiotolerans]